MVADKRSPGGPYGATVMAAVSSGDHYAMVTEAKLRRAQRRSGERRS